jgi:hypothetical protein
MAQYRGHLAASVKGISKISVQTGTTHGGIALPDGTIARVELDFDTLEKLSRIAREEYALGGAVQHGASTLPDEMFDIFPGKGTLEVHLATFPEYYLRQPWVPEAAAGEDQCGPGRRHLGDKSSETKASSYTQPQRAFGDFARNLGYARG